MPELWINEVGVAATHQGQGVGKALMKALLDLARERGCRDAWVVTDADNHAAIRLYETAGGTATRDHVMFTFRWTIPPEPASKPRPARLVLP